MRADNTTQCYWTDDGTLDRKRCLSVWWFRGKGGVRPRQQGCDDITALARYKDVPAAPRNHSQLLLAGAATHDAGWREEPEPPPSAPRDPASDPRLQQWEGCVSVASGAEVQLL